MVIVFVESILSIFVVKFVYNVNLLAFVLYDICGFGHCVKKGKRNFMLDSFLLNAASL